MVGKREVIVVLVAYFAYRFLWSAPTKFPAPIVRTESGELEGVRSLSRDGREFFNYLGIPYAKAPIEQLRFEPPEAPEKWTGIRKATEFGEQCIQVEHIFGGTQVGSEDCLFLNVVTPNSKPKNGALLPTMVFIHGGLYQEGSSNMYLGDYFMDQDVVLVTINYRLAILGFLNTGDDVVRGNMGLKDQNLALKWVQTNIANFGGDPKKVTIFGESAGGASVQFHMLSPMSKGLFRKAISQSGNVLNVWAHTDKPLEEAHRLGKQLGCPTETSVKLVDCLKKLPVDKIIGAQVGAGDPVDFSASVYLPSIEAFKDESAFLTEHPEKLLKNAQNGIPWMTGINSHEGLVSYAPIIRNQTLRKFLQDKENWLESIPKMNFLNGLKREDTLDLRKFYFGTDEIIDYDGKHFENFTNLFSDINFNYGFYKTVQLHARHSPVYAYHFNYAADFSIYNFLVAMKRNYSPKIEMLGYLVNNWFKKFFGVSSPRYGASHVDELVYLFKFKTFAEISPNDEDYEMSKRMVKLWTDFAKDETSMELMDTPWKAFDPNAKEFMCLNLDRTPGYVQQPPAARMKFIERIIKSI